MAQNNLYKNEENVCELSPLSSQTKVGLTFGQIITLITYTGIVVWMYASISWRVSNIEKKQEEIKDLKESTIKIEQSLIRIEGKIDMKADKEWIK